MHEVPWLYRNFHSHHHRLYVPYAFGALYNHWLEGLVLDSLGAALAEMATGMTVRQTVLLFGFASAKTVDDHSGYRLWWDPLQVRSPSPARPVSRSPRADLGSPPSPPPYRLHQMLFANNADYHDIHHQSFGIKSNFSSVPTSSLPPSLPAARADDDPSSPSPPRPANRSSPAGTGCSTRS